MLRKIKILLLLGCIFMLPGLTSAATYFSLADKTSATSNDSLKVKSAWVAGLETANNSSFYGRNTATRFPYVAGTITYVHKTGLWASATSYQLFRTEDYIDETDLSVGYSLKIGKKVDATVSYSRFFFGKNSPLVKSVISNVASVNAAMDWNILYTGLTTSYIFGRTNDVFVVLDNSRYVSLNRLWNGKTPIGLDPKISITGGTQQFSETYTTTVTEEKKSNGKNSGVVGGILDPVIPGNNNNSNGNNGNTTTTTTTKVKHTFKVLTYDFKVPVVINLGNLEVEPAWRYSIPVNLVEGDESKAQSFYSLNLNYTF